jgi:NADP-dependent 3-hydroxy acid dehydrogenase YdfG
VLIDREYSQLQTVADTLPGDSLILETELADDASVAAAIDRLRARWDHIDVLVNNAGSEFPTPYENQWFMMRGSTSPCANAARPIFP